MRIAITTRNSGSHARWSLPYVDKLYWIISGVNDKEVVVNIGEADDNIKVPNTSARSKNLSWQAQTPIG